MNTSAEKMPASQAPDADKERVSKPRKPMPRPVDFEGDSWEPSLLRRLRSVKPKSVD